MKLNKYDIILSLLTITEIVLSSYVALLGNKSDYLCTVGSGCDFVRSSIYGSLFGMKLAWFGVICFSILLVLFLIARFNKKLYWMYFLASIVGAAFAIYFISLQVFVLKQICTDCIIIDSGMILMLLIVIFEFIDFRKELRQLEKSAEKTIGIK